MKKFIRVIVSIILVFSFFFIGPQVALGAEFEYAELILTVMFGLAWLLRLLKTTQKLSNWEGVILACSAIPVIAVVVAWTGGAVGELAESFFPWALYIMTIAITIIAWSKKLED